MRGPNWAVGTRNQPRTLQKRARNVGSSGFSAEQPGVECAAVHIAEEGLSVEEAADVLHVSADTVKRDWRLAKLWLLRELDGDAR
jgi:hypothetical protein